MEVGHALGYQTGAAYVNNERMSDLNVMISVSLCWPHVVPERPILSLCVTWIVL